MASYRRIDKPGQEQFHGFYFVLHFDTSSEQRFAVHMCNSIDMVIVSNARIQDPLLIIVTQGYLQVRMGGIKLP